MDGDTRANSSSKKCLIPKMLILTLTVVVSDASEQERPRSGARTSGSAPKRVLGLWNLWKCMGPFLMGRLLRKTSEKTTADQGWFLGCSISLLFQQKCWIF